MKKNGNRVGERARRYRSAEVRELTQVFDPWLDASAALSEAQRERLLAPARVFWLFLSQMFSADGSSAEAVRKFLAWLALTEGKEASPNTAAYCKARARLPMKDIEQVRDDVGRAIQQSPLAQSRWHGRPVTVVDGSGLSMPDTAKNQQEYPQSKRAKPGCGFPEMRIAALFSLATGALLHYAEASRYVAERTLFRQLWTSFESGDVVLADRRFCGFAELFLLLQRGVDSVMRLHQRRSFGVRLVKQLGPGDLLVEWIKTKVRPKWLSAEQWAAMPDTLLVRHITYSIDIPGFRTQRITIATTLTDARLFPPQAFAALFRRRWNVELYFRDIKISLRMDVLRCLTPDMVRKELAMHVIAYNLIRATMLQAAHAANKDADRMSFKRTCQTLREWASLLALAPEKQLSALHTALLHAIARDPLPARPNRTEPRARKRRPKNYQLLNQPRHQFKEIPHRNKYVKTT
jgi:hypothetical protein